jgi:hypothetical protein
MLKNYKPIEVNLPESISSIISQNLNLNKEYLNKKFKNEINTIGLSKYILYKDNNEIHCYDYNYLLSKKFKMLKSEAFANSTKFFFLINVHDSRGVDNLKIILEELFTLRKENKEKTTLIGVLIKQSNNFLLSLTQSIQVENISNNFKFDSFIEFEIDDEDYSELINKTLGS